jgi:hypothetical protein
METLKNLELIENIKYKLSIYNKINHYKLLIIYDINYYVI